MLLVPIAIGQTPNHSSNLTQACPEGDDDEHKWMTSKHIQTYHSKGKGNEARARQYVVNLAHALIQPSFCPITATTDAKEISSPAEVRSSL